jgi:hypothetical protein
VDAQRQQVGPGVRWFEIVAEGRDVPGIGAAQALPQAEKR